MSAPDSFSVLWAAAVEKFEREHECSLDGIVPKAFSKTPEDILNQADLDFDKFREKGRALRSTIKPFTDTLLVISETLGDIVRLSYPPAEVITAAVIVLIKGSTQLGENYDAIKDLLVDLQFILDRTKQYARLDSSPQVKDMIIDSLVQTLNVISLAATTAKDGRCRGFLKTLIHKDRKIQEAVAKLDKLSSREGHTINLSILKATTEILKVVGHGIASQTDHSQTVQSVLSAITDQLQSIKDEIIEEISQLSTPLLDAIRQKELEKIRPKFDFQAEHDPCLEGTRLDILGIIHNWMEDVDAPNVFWLYGHPGTGKSAIATTVRHELARQRRLGATCFFRREDTDFHKPRDVVLSIASDLATKHDFIGASIIRKLQEGKLDVKDASPSQLFESLVVETLQDVAAGFNDTIVVVIDALDEFGGADPYNDPQYILLNTLLSKWDTLPSCFKLFVTSRDQGDISAYLKVGPNWCQSLEVGEAATTQSSKDIRHFFEVKLSMTAQRRRRVAWTPSAVDLDILTTAASGLFIWASTVVNLVSRHRAQFDLIVTQVRNGSLAGSTPLAGLERLYQNILEAASQDWDVQTLVMVCGAIITARVPLSCSTLSSLLQLDERDIDDIVSHLRPVLDTSSELRFVHKSFVDYMTSERCPERLRCITVIQEQKLLDACFAVMERELHFDMASIGSSHLLNKDIPGLVERINEPTKYGCRFWGSHLELLGESIDLKTIIAVERFFEQLLLAWLEVVSIMECIDQALKSLVILAGCIGSLREDLARQARDVELLLRMFTIPISQSYPHIYLSALAFSPQSSFVKTQYLKLYPSSIKVLSGFDINWSPQLGTLNGHDQWTTSVAFSPDGRLLLSASGDKTIRLWDATTRKPIGEPLLGHEEGIMSAAFSPDGRQIASGSWDKTVRMWDVGTRQPIGVPLRGHEDYITTVCFSPDGKKLLSASADKTIRLWDAVTHKSIGEPLQGHVNVVESAAFSPDGKQIISGAWNAIHIWDAATQQPIGELLRGSGYGIKSIAFSPDGLQIVSGFWNKTIRFWDAVTWQPLGEHIRGHEDHITSVCFSPDGKQLLSASADKTIRLWNAATHELIGEPLRGHVDGVKLAAFSPDGKQIISGSWDKTVRLWYVTTHRTAQEMPQGHDNGVQSVAFSPDGKHIISASLDTTIRIWDAVTLRHVGQPLQGHEGAVNSVAFSPDGKHIASASRDTTIRIWDLAARPPIGIPLQGHQNTVNSVAFSPDGRYIASASLDRTIRIWDAISYQPVGEPLRGHEDGVRYVTFSPEGKHIVSTSHDKTIRIWDTTTHQPIGNPLQGSSHTVSSVAYSPDGTRLVSGSWNATITFWDRAIYLPIGEPLRWHRGSINSVAFSPVDGKYVVSSSLDTTICIWDAARQRPVVDQLRGHENDVSSVAYSPNGKQLVSGSADNTLCLWDVETLLASPEEYLYPESFKKRFRATKGLDDTLILLDDGWVLHGETFARLFWVPHHLHLYIRSLGMTAVIGRRRMVKLDLTSFHHGESWAKCRESPHTS